MNILLLGNMSDMQSGLYIVNSLVDLGHTVQYIDTRDSVKKLGVIKAQEEIKEALISSTIKPELVMVLKGLEMTTDTLQYIKDTLKCVVVNWMFDVYIGDRKIWENKDYFESLKKYDYYFCSLKGVADKLKERGFENARYLPEGCFPELHGEQFINNFQRKKYGNDISFCGSIGLTAHTNRISLLKKAIEEGFCINIYGDVTVEWKHIPSEIKRCHMGEYVINERHSMVAQTSLINLGIDQDPELSLSQSARMYRVMCAGGLYLTTYVKDLETMFKINSKGAPITADQELAVFYDESDLIKKLDFLLSNDAIRESIAKNGQKIVVEKHTFKDRLNEMLEVIKDGM
jgi:spore maturation protein CgeB